MSSTGTYRILAQKGLGVRVKAVIVRGGLLDEQRSSASDSTWAPDDWPILCLHLESAPPKRMLTAVFRSTLEQPELTLA